MNVDKFAQYIFSRILRCIVDVGENESEKIKHCGTKRINLNMVWRKNIKIYKDQYANIYLRENMNVFSNRKS